MLRVIPINDAGFVGGVSFTVGVGGIRTVFGNRGTRASRSAGLGAGSGALFETGDDALAIRDPSILPDIV